MIQLQVRDTVELFHFRRHRKLSLRFLASYILGSTIQVRMGLFLCCLAWAAPACLMRTCTPSRATSRGQPSRCVHVCMGLFICCLALGCAGLLDAHLRPVFTSPASAPPARHPQYACPWGAELHSLLHPAHNTFLACFCVCNFQDRAELGHDSVEDARTALRLYQAYLKMQVRAVALLFRRLGLCWLLCWLVLGCLPHGAEAVPSLPQDAGACDFRAVSP